MEYTNIQKNLIFLSLTNLVEEYTNALEEDQINQEMREFMTAAIIESNVIIENLKSELDLNTPHPMSRPSWNEEEPD